MRARKRDECVTTFALAVTHVFVYSVNCGRRWWRRRGNLPEAASRLGGFVIGVHTRIRARVHVCVCIYAARAANDLCIPLITSVHCTVLSGDHSFIRPTCALRYCQRQKHPRHAEQPPYRLHRNAPRILRFVTLRARAFSGSETVLRDVSHASQI